MAYKTVYGIFYRYELPDGSALKCFAFAADEAVYTAFTDGTGLLLCVDHDGPYSEVTPDVDVDVELYAVTGHPLPATTRERGRPV